MKNDISFTGEALPERFQDLIELSEISAPFRDFVEKHLLPSHCRFPHYKASGDQLLFALGKAKSVTGTNEAETLTLQVLKLIETIGLPLDHFEVRPAIKRIGELYWQDRALEFFVFLVHNGDYPVVRWRSILCDHENYDALPWFDRPKTKSKPIENQIVEGLIRHSHEKPPESSAFSLCFWFNIELWRTEPRMPGLGTVGTKNRETGEWERDEDEDKSTAPWESAQYPHNKTLFNSVLRSWTIAMLEANNEDAVYAFLNWANNQNIKEHLEENQLESIWEQLQQRPFPLPLYPLALKDIPASIRALCRELWSNGNEAFNPSDDLRENLQKQLAQVAQLCAEDRLKFKLPLNTIRDLILVLDWVPDGYIRNPNYIEPGQDALAIKLLALMRSCIQHEPQAFDIYDYRDSMKHLVWKKKETAVLRQLLMTLRTCPQPCSNEALNFRPKREIIGYITNVNFSELSPGYCLSCMIDLLIGSHQIEDRRRELCIDLADYFISRLKFRKQKGRKRSEEKLSDCYDEKKCVEPVAMWRRAYAEALGELGYALDGKVIHLLDFVRKHDPDESVRETAHSSYRLIHREQTKELDDYKSLRAAFWALRLAQRQTLELPIELAQAKLLRRQEMRNERQTDASLIYTGYLDLY
ncbi:MAG: hypothetical protein CML13_09030 [Puniceicoccaceae bacterium]|nr:hypothetical protein [Puniceicoccaceae bacterium]|tara:strand:+ start:585 stop:2507 length:1923 start_codon:yes stop_codon:yes gene_type:complete